MELSKKEIIINSWNIIKNHLNQDAEGLVSEGYIKFIRSYDKGTSSYELNTNIVAYLMSIIKMAGCFISH